MKKSCFLILFLFAFIPFGFSQNDADTYDFFGGKTFEKQAIFYRLLFKIEDGKVNGYAFTDEQGAQETKSIIKGTFNPKTKKIFFTETKKLLTKSKKPLKELCYLQGIVSFKLDPIRSVMEGTFIETRLDGRKCTNGKIKIISPDSYGRLKETLDKEIAQVNKKPEAVKDTPEKDAPSFQSEEKITIKDDEEVTIFWKSDEFTLDIWDDAKEDDDQITITFNDEDILKKHTLKNRKESITLDLEEGENKIVFTADNTGFIANNTARVDLFDGDTKHQIITQLKLNRSVTVYLVRE